MERNNPGGRGQLAFYFAIAATAVVLLFWLQRVLLLAFVGLLLGILLDTLARGEVRLVRMPRAVALILAAVLVVAGVLSSISPPGSDGTAPHPPDSEATG